MKKIIFHFLFITIACCLASGLCADQWKLYTNCNDINALAIEGDTILWATVGGIVKWNRSNGTYEQYTALDFQNDIGYHGYSAVTIDNNGTKLFGCGGVLTSFDGTHFTSHDIPGMPNSIAVDHDKDPFTGIGIQMV